MSGIPLTADEVVISDRGGGNERRLAVMQANCSWELSAAGMFSAFASIPDLLRAGFSPDLKAHWLTWDSPAGPWGGVVTGVPITDGVAEIASMAWPILLRGRVLDSGPITAPAGAIMRRVLQDATRSEPTFLTIGQMDESGPALSVVYEGQDAYDVLGTIDGEWRVDPVSRRFDFGQRVGDDRSASVRLVEGRHIATYRAGDDLWTMSNRLVGASAAAEHEVRKWFKQDKRRQKVGRAKRKKLGKKWRKYTVKIPMLELQIDPFTGLTLGSLDSIQQYGPLERVMDYPDTRDQGAIEAQLRRDLAELSNPPTPLDLTLIDVDGCYRRFAEGDVVWVDIGSAGLSGAFRVMNRSVGDAGSLRVAGDLRPLRSA